jgi:hypothetical protein
MNQLHYEPHDRLTTGEVMCVLRLSSYDEVKKVLQAKGIDNKPAYGRSFTIKYSELVKAGLIRESNS